MPIGLTRKFDYEKGKRQANVQKPDYRERFQDEGQSFNRGGKERKELWNIGRTTISFDMSSAYLEDKKSLFLTLQSWLFVIDGNVGTISQLKKNPKLVGRNIKERLEILRKLIMRADEITAIANHPKKGRKFRVVEFNCNFRPVEPYPNPIFKRYLAFSLKLVGPALTGE